MVNDRKFRRKAEGSDGELVAVKVSPMEALHQRERSIDGDFARCNAMTKKTLRELPFPGPPFKAGVVGANPAARTTVSNLLMLRPPARCGFLMWSMQAQVHQ